TSARFVGSIWAAAASRWSAGAVTRSCATATANGEVLAHLTERSTYRSAHLDEAGERDPSAVRRLAHGVSRSRVEAALSFAWRLTAPRSDAWPPGGRRSRARPSARRTASAARSRAWGLAHRRRAASPRRSR